jgi:hypothetical protein
MATVTCEVSGACTTKSAVSSRFPRALCRTRTGDPFLTINARAAAARCLLCESPCKPRGLALTVPARRHLVLRSTASSALPSDAASCPRRLPFMSRAIRSPERNGESKPRREAPLSLTAQPLEGQRRRVKRESSGQRDQLHRPRRHLRGAHEEESWASPLAAERARSRQGGRADHAARGAAARERPTRSCSSSTGGSAASCTGARGTSSSPRRPTGANLSLRILHAMRRYAAARRGRAPAATAAGSSPDGLTCQQIPESVQPSRAQRDTRPCARPAAPPAGASACARAGTSSRERRTGPAPSLCTCGRRPRPRERTR